jgi:ubiquinone/menaquinone biosynthesis C-methylase UbiE
VPTRKKLGLSGGAAILGAAVWWRRHPSACPYNQRFWVEAPHPFITRPRLLEALAPQPGERILEIGPGTGYYSLPVAQRLAPHGTLDIFDVQQEMLDHTMRRAGEHGLANITPTQGDARELPYADSTFDGAFLVAVLGEIPDQGQALREVGRVLKPDGRLVVGELFGDPHMVRLSALKERARDAGLQLDRRVGPLFGYFARLSPRGRGIGSGSGEGGSGSG